jgi:hypothetical protein
MADPEDRYDAIGIIDRVDHAVVTLPQAKPILVPCQLLTAGRARLAGQRLNANGEPLSIGLPGDAIELLRG